MFQSHLTFAHQFWEKILNPGDWAIDATCGRGRDTLKLAACVGPSGGVIALDIQKEAIEATRAAIEGHSQVHLFHASHEAYPLLCHENPIKLIVYNLGYLPGGDKNLTTHVETTLLSIERGLELLVEGGAMCITCYPGHPEGALELKALLDMPLDTSRFQVTHYAKQERPLAPSVLIILKKC